ncbi:nucleotidyltransferase [Candidatus Uhrbacteria bacterium]|nr:nucleotidyltransferase [Candidatus Uhrbacteria bacterium]
MASLEEVFVQPKTVIVRDATIQRFEYTFELAIKMIQRYFQEKSPLTQNVDELTFNDLCRLAAEAGLIKDPKEWFKYRDARNKSSHAYDEQIAENVYQDAKLFLADVQFLLSVLEKRV